MTWRPVPPRLVRGIVTTLPTFDDNPSATHPSVVHVPGGWNGYEYWMLFTPFPDATREDPSVAVSHDGVTWRKLLDDNRIFTRDQTLALGFQWNADTHLVLVGDELWAYHRPANDSSKEAVYLQKSADGVTWSAAQLVLLSMDESAGGWLMSPSIEIDGDGLFHMWYVSAEDGDTPRAILHRTSADGETFGDPETCTIGNDVNPWHLDVKVADGTYYMLVSGDLLPGKTQGNRLYWLTSEDGVAWDGSETPALPRTGDLSVDARHYRSCVWPKSDGTWKVWVSGIPSVDEDGPPWRLIYYEGVTLAAV